MWCTHHWRSKTRTKKRVIQRTNKDCEQLTEEQKYIVNFTAKLQFTQICCHCDKTKVVIRRFQDMTAEEIMKLPIAEI